MSNAYHILQREPAQSAQTLAPELEALARQLLASGRLRINADHARNYVIYSGPSFDKSFSRRELSVPAFMDEVRRVIADTLPGSAGAQGVEEVLLRLQRELKRGGEITPEREVQVARLLVQAAHPSVILLAMLEKVDIFVSYSHNVADLMGVHFWESHGSHSGLQSVSGDGTAVYVSCGGDPFISDDKHKTYTTDGFPALARMMVIAAQEFGHFADITRGPSGVPIGRHSAMMEPLRAREAMRQARHKDMEQVRRLYQQVHALGLARVVKAEKALGFARQHRKASPFTLLLGVRVWWMVRQFQAHAARAGCALVVQFPAQRIHEARIGFASELAECLRDMAFNLAPDADAYRRDDPAEEEAIAVIEALARVPQQVVKWGHKVTREAWPNLYAAYYRQVIPACVAAYERASGKRYHFSATSAARRSRITGLNLLTKIRK